MASKNKLLKYLFSAVLSIFGLSFHFILTPHLNLLPFILAHPIIFAIASLCGFGPALLGIFVWSLGLGYFQFSPILSLRIDDALELIHLSVFIMTAAILSFIVNRNRQKEKKQSLIQKANLAKTIQLEYENKLKDQFVNTLSHDLKSPLSVALMCTALIERNSTNPEKVISLARKATSSLSRVDKMILDLLDSRRISAGNPLNMVMEKFDLGLMLKETTNDFSALNGDRFRLHGPDTYEIVGCEKYLRRAIENLLSNAIKYGDPVKTIELGIDPEGEMVDIWVCNRGNLLSEEDIQKMFKQFSRLNPEDTSKEGWGIGLTLVKAIVDGHHGKLKVISNEEKGTRFHILIPISQNKENPT